MGGHTVTPSLVRWTARWLATHTAASAITCGAWNGMTHTHTHTQLPQRQQSRHPTHSVSAVQCVRGCGGALWGVGGTMYPLSPPCEPHITPTPLPSSTSTVQSATQVGTDGSSFSSHHPPCRGCGDSGGVRDCKMCTQSPHTASAAPCQPHRQVQVRHGQDTSRTRHCSLAPPHPLDL